MPKPSFGFGFFKLDRRGDLVTDDSTVEPLDPKVVDVVYIEAMLPFVAAVYGLPLASVIDMPPSENDRKLYNILIFNSGTRGILKCFFSILLSSNQI